jgi:cytochrome d ubiquinol oxidase subunit II
MGPVWEANHVWLIFVLTVTWTAYPAAFGAIASTLAVPLFIAGLGVVFRGATYALRSGSSRASELALIDTVFSISSILTPYALGATIGAIASLRVPQGNATGHLFGSWLNPTSTLVGVLAVAVSGYMAAVYLAADASREGKRELAEQFRTRALLAGALAGAAAIAGLPILHSDAHRIYARLTDGPGLPGLIVSVIAGLATLALVQRRRFEPARVSAALAVVGLIAGWALAQQPLLLAHLTLQAAAAPHDALVGLLVAIAMGAVVLFPSLGLLFSLVLRGRLDHGPRASAGAGLPGDRSARRAQAAPAGMAGRLALAGLLGGFGLLTVAEASWAHAVGVACLFAAMILGVVAVDPAGLARGEER